MKMADSIAILVQLFSILVLDQFFQCRKMRLELAHLRKFKRRLFEQFFRSFRSIKVRSIANFANGSS